MPLWTWLRNSTIVVALAVPLTVLVASWAGFGIRLLSGRRRRLAILATLAVLLVPVTAVWATRFELFQVVGVIDTGGRGRRTRAAAARGRSGQRGAGARPADQRAWICRSDADPGAAVLSGGQGPRVYQEAKGLELFEIEDEVFEAEVLFAGQKFRSYVKAQAQCDTGSVLIVFVGPGETGDLPSVGGG